MSNKKVQPDRVAWYFKAEWWPLLLVTISGLIYNLGLLAGPWFEGQMTGCLIRILQGSGTFSDMLRLILWYVAVIAIVQGARYIKRFYVRRFANNVSRKMKGILYGNLVQKSRTELEEEGAGNLMTKAILDVDDCAEGMRKFTTEIFDTGVALLAYACMLLYYDWRLGLLCMLFPPISYVVAEKMKVLIQRTGAAFKAQSGVLSAATLDRGTNAITYRVFGCEKQRQEAYEQNLTDYEKSAVRANIWNTMLPPVYKVISMAGVLFILFFGSKNVLGSGWKAWDVAAFTTFLACFTKLSTKSSSATKLFNAVHKAQVSWKRIKPLMHAPEELPEAEAAKPDTLEVRHLSFAYAGGKDIIHNLSFDAKPGQIIGITGPVACGKSTLGKTFLCEYPYAGDIRYGGKELSRMDRVKRTGIVGYLGHDPELFNDTVRNNILMGDEQLDPWEYLRYVCLDGEVKAMEDGIETLVGSGGVRLSGGQGQRLSLARTLSHKRPILVLDDPFSALDRNTESQIFENLKNLASDSIVLLISHRLYLFPELDQVIWMDGGAQTVGTHQELMESVPDYAALFHAQEGGKQYAEA